MKESRLIKDVREYCRVLRGLGVPIKCIKLHGNRFSEAGTPDLHITCQGRSIWLEAKSGKNAPTAIQLVRLSEWEAAGAIARVVRSVEDVRTILRDAFPELSDVL